ncbi:MAG: hypothetical protein GF329_16620 [Candidatus Lokiarchaeota archaeon]|nr:hypothetical protein [Candidatus Lokiarchaeota archaeon]
MPWSPPKKITVIITVILEIIGLILAFLGSLNMIPIIGSMDFNLISNISGYLICFFGWFILLLGVFLRGF